MGNPYNKHYEKEAYFGKPYPGLVDFFSNYPERNTVLDLGCGQGRDALFLGRIGYRVVGVDISDVGIQQMNATAQKEKLPVTGIVADIYSFSITEEYDMILLDSILHFNKNEIEKEAAFLKRIIDTIKYGGVICNFMQNSVNRQKQLKDAVRESGVSVEVLLDGCTDYLKYNAEVHMYIMKKTIPVLNSRSHG